MLALKVSIIYVIVGAAICQQVATDDERPYLRILAPKFICNDKKGQPGGAATSSSNLTIALQTREGQKLRYQISVDFDMLDGFKSQKHTLSIWKNIRMLQKKFVNISDEISLKNQIEINSQELTPQVIYTFKITGYDGNNLASETQNFTMTYKGGELKAQRSNLGDGVSLLLFSPEFFYDDMELLAVAKVSFCDPINDYSFKWKIIGSDGNEAESFSGNFMRLPSGFLQPGQHVEIFVAAMNNESLTMASAALPVKILAKEFQLQVAPSECLVGGREIPFQALLTRESSSAAASIKWSCTKDGVDCSESLGNQSMLSQLASFSEEGSYEIIAEMTINKVSKSASSKVNVNAKVIPHVQIKYFPSQPVNVMQPIEIVVTVLNLIPKCVAYWNIVPGDGFAGFRKGSEGNLTNMGMTVINDFEEYFLQELVDYDNSTLSKDVTLTIPPKVLLASEKYKFRLSMTCPEPITDANPQNQIANITSFYDIIFETNAPPETFPLVVTPLRGIPMKQRFKFSTGAAKDFPSNFPLKYTFGYTMSNLTVIIGSFYEHDVAHTQLPLADAIETFCEVCDNNKACVRFAGPTIAANEDYKYPSSEMKFKLAEFGATLRRAEYSDSLNSAVVFFSLRSKWETEDGQRYEAEIFAMMLDELENLKSTDGFFYHQKVIEFVKMSKIVMSLMQSSDETFVDDLLSLTETISRPAKRLKRIVATRDSFPKVVSHDTEYIRNVLGLSEILLSSNNATIVQREKGKFVAKVHQFVRSMCQDKNLNSQFIETQWASFEVCKVFSPQLYVEAQKMPGGGDSTLLFNLNSIFPSKYVCVAKVRFTMDMFDVSTNETLTPVYETIILENEQETFKAVKANEFSSGVSVDIGVSTDALAMTCSIWKNENWSSGDCSKLKTNATNRVACKCKTSSMDGVIIKTVKLPADPVVPGEAAVHQTEVTTIKIDSTASRTDATTPFTFLSTPTTEKMSEILSTTKLIDVPVTPSFQPSSQPIKSSAAPSPITSTTAKSVVATAQTSRSPQAPNQTTSKFEPVTVAVNATPSYNASSENFKTVSESSVSWVVIVIILLLGSLILIMVLFSAHKFRRYGSAQFNLPMRSPSTSIKYAKYHDEFTMQG